MRIAPPKARLLAGLLDRLVVVLGMVSVVGAGIGAAVLYERVRGTPAEGAAAGDVDGDAEGAEDGDAEGSFELSGPQKVVLWLAGTGLSVRLRNRRSLGARALRLRRVDLGTGGPVTARGAMLGAVFEWAWGAAIQRAQRGDRERTQQRMSELSARLKEIEQRHADDPRARRQAVTELYKTDTLHLRRGCGWQFATTTIWQLVPSIPIGRRCIRDWVTGTVVVVDR